MAQPSRLRPWTVEMQPPGVGVDQWFAMDAYRDQDAAEANARLMKARVPDAKFRVIRAV